MVLARHEATVITINSWSDVDSYMQLKHIAECLDLYATFDYVHRYCTVDPR